MTKNRNWHTVVNASSVYVLVLTLLLATMMPLASASTLSVSNINIGSTELVYNQNTTVNAVVAGGVGPYTANLMWCKLSMAACTLPPGALANTIAAELPTSGNFLTFTVNAFSYNTLQVGFNGVTYTILTPAVIPDSANILYATNFLNPNNAVFANTIYGPWQFNGIISDSAGNSISLMPISPPTVISVNPAVPQLQFLSPGGSLAFITNYGNNTLEIVQVNQANISASKVTSALTVQTGPKSLVSPPSQVSLNAPSIVGTVNYGANSITVINTAIKEVMMNMSLGAGALPIAVAPASNSASQGMMAFAEYGTDNIIIINASRHGFKNFSISLAGKISGPDALDTFFDRTGNATLWVAGKDNGNVVSINLNTMQVSNAISLGANAMPEGIAASPMGFVYVADYGTNTVSVINASSPNPGVIANITGSGAMALDGPSSITIDYKSPKIYITNYNSNTISIADGIGYRILNTVIVNSLTVSGPDYVSTSPDGTLLYVSNYNANVVSVLSTSNDVVVGTLPANEPTGVNIFSNFFYNGSAPSNAVFEIISPGNQLLATASEMDRPGNFIPIATTSNTLPYSFASAHNQSFLFFLSTQGNANYFPSMIAKGFSIMPSFPQIQLSLTLANGTVLNLNKQNQTVSLSGFPSTLFPMTLTANVQTFGNQLPANIFLDGTPVNSFSSSFSKTYTSLSPGLQSFIFNAIGNGNYMSVDPSISLTVLSAPTCGETCVRQSGGTGVVTSSAVTTRQTTTVQPTTTVAMQHGNSPYIMRSGNTLSITLNVTSPANVVVNNTGLSLQIISISSGPANVTVSNDTNSSPPAPAYTKKIITFNISVGTAVNVSTNVSMHYPCSENSSDVVPYKLVNGSWSKIIPFQVDASSCTVIFSITKDPIVGLFQSATPPQTVPTTQTSTTPALPTTSAAQVQATSQSGASYLPWVAAVIVVALAAWYFASRKRK